jgi:hypothetical protein
MDRSSCSLTMVYSGNAPLRSLRRDQNFHMLEPHFEVLSAVDLEGQFDLLAARIVRSSDSGETAEADLPDAEAEAAIVFDRDICPFCCNPAASGSVESGRARISMTRYRRALAHHRFAGGTGISARLPIREASASRQPGRLWEGDEGTHRLEGISPNCESTRWLLGARASEISGWRRSRQAAAVYGQKAI